MGIKYKPNYAKAYMNIGAIFQEKKDYDNSLFYYNKAVAIEPDYLEAYNNIGKLYFIIGLRNKSLSYYKKCVSLNPKSVGPLNNMGIAYLALGELELSIKYFSDALKLNPYYLNAAWNLCGTSKNITEARKNLESCISIDPKFDKANFTYSAIDYYEGKKENFITLKLEAKKL